MAVIYASVSMSAPVLASSRYLFISPSQSAVDCPVNTSCVFACTALFKSPGLVILGGAYPPLSGNTPNLGVVGVAGVVSGCPGVLGINIASLSGSIWGGRPGCAGALGCPGVIGIPIFSLSGNVGPTSEPCRCSKTLAKSDLPGGVRPILLEIIAISCADGCGLLIS